MCVFRLYAGLFSCLLMVSGVFGEADYRVIEVKNGGKVSGVVRFADEYPPSERIKVANNIDICGFRKSLENFVVEPESKGLANVVIRIEGITAGKDFDDRLEPVITQRTCIYFPHVQVYRSKEQLTVLNEDNLLHNVHVYAGEQTLFNVAQPAGTGKLVRPLETSEAVAVKCDVHEWMNAYLVPVAHPYFAITDEVGRFEIDQVPPGTYKIQAWHEVIGIMEKTAKVASSATAEVVFEIVAGE